MKLVRGLGAVLVAVLAGAPFAASAQVPTQMPIQGFLTDAGGTPINGATSIRFAIYDSDTGATPLFSETQSVMVDNGNFAAYLGDTAALDLTIFGSGAATFVGITVGADPEMTPRLALGTVPYAALAEFARNVRWADITGVPAPIAGFDPSMLQRRVSGTCPGGSSISAIAVDGTVTCETDDVGAGGGGGDITGVTAGRGLLGGAPMGDASLAVDPATVQNRVGGTCPAGSSINAIAMDGTVTCEADNDTTYARGAGLSLTGTTFAVDFLTVQARVAGTCPAGQSIRSIDGAGAVICEIDDDTNTTYLAGAGLMLTGTTFSAIPYVAGAGLSLVGTTFSVNTAVIQNRVSGTCPVGQAIRTVNADGTVICNPPPIGLLVDQVVRNATVISSPSGFIAVGAAYTPTQNVRAFLLARCHWDANAASVDINIRAATRTGAVVNVGSAFYIAQSTAAANDTVSVTVTDFFDLNSGTAYDLGVNVLGFTGGTSLDECSIVAQFFSR